MIPGEIYQIIPSTCTMSWAIDAHRLHSGDLIVIVQCISSIHVDILLPDGHVEEATRAAINRGAKFILQSHQETP